MRLSVCATWPLSVMQDLQLECFEIGMRKSRQRMLMLLLCSALGLDLHQLKTPSSTASLETKYLNSSEVVLSHSAFRQLPFGEPLISE